MYLLSKSSDHLPHGINRSLLINSAAVGDLVLMGIQPDGNEPLIPVLTGGFEFIDVVCMIFLTASEKWSRKRLKQCPTPQ